MNQLSAFAPAIVGAVSLVVVFVAILRIAYRPPAKIRAQQREAKKQAQLPLPPRPDPKKVARSYEREPAHDY
jgi:cbb3-type cytochrome oxidase subunit 3